MERLTAKLNDAVETIPRAKYSARADPEKRGYHLPIDSDVQIELPPETRFVTLVCSRVGIGGTTDKTAIKARADISLDGGKTWDLLCSFSAPGGDLPEPDGGFVQESYFGVEAPKDQGAGRLVRTMMVPLEEITTSIMVKAR